MNYQPVDGNDQWAQVKSVAADFAAAAGWLLDFLVDLADDITVESGTAQHEVTGNHDNNNEQRDYQCDAPDYFS